MWRIEGRKWCSFGVFAVEVRNLYGVEMVNVK